jgi:hypothetical protein
MCWKLCCVLYSVQCWPSESGLNGILVGTNGWFCRQHLLLGSLCVCVPRGEMMTHSVGGGGGGVTVKKGGINYTTKRK